MNFLFASSAASVKPQVATRFLKSILCKLYSQTTGSCQVSGERPLMGNVGSSLDLTAEISKWKSKWLPEDDMALLHQPKCQSDLNASCLVICCCKLSSTFSKVESVASGRYCCSPLAFLIWFPLLFEFTQQLILFHSGKSLKLKVKLSFVIRITYM